MTLEERIEAGLEAAKRKWAELTFMAKGDGKPAFTFEEGFTEEFRDRFEKFQRPLIETALSAAVPELFFDPPHWLAPHEATKAMQGELIGVDEMWWPDGELQARWLKIRDAYLTKDKA